MEICDRMIPDILICTFKKSASVTKKLLYCAAYLLLGAIFCAILWVGSEIVIPVILNIINSGSLLIWEIFVSVPWYVWVFIVVGVAIVTYSFLWCIMRDLVDDDWESVGADRSAIGVIITLIVLTDAAVTIVVNDSNINPITVLTITAIAVIIAIIIAFAIDPVSERTVWYYIFRFPGAVWNHYMRWC